MGSVYLALLPACEPWAIFERLPFDNWVGRPGALEIMAVAKRWHEQFGAEPVIIKADTLEFLVDRPPRRDEALQLALEQIAFCPDLLAECTPSVGALANSLPDWHTWQFWWD